MKRTLLMAILAGMVGLTAAQIGAAQTMYGSQLMTEQERIEHRAKMRSLQTEEERQAYRQEHHKRMQERATEMGVTLPDEPPARGRGMGPQGGGMGQGKGQGGYRRN